MKRKDVCKMHVEKKKEEKNHGMSKKRKGRVATAHVRETVWRKWSAPLIFGILKPMFEKFPNRILIYKNIH